MSATAQTSSQQFLSIDDDQEGEKRVHLDEEVVSSYLLSDEVADKPVVVISVAGAFRTGKSFLLNSMTRYLKASDKSRWLEDTSESFPWQSGCKAHTNGMSMSRPIPITLQSGEEATLLLLDTQGIFDDSSTEADSTRIFALSALLSSVQVFNMMNNLKSDDLGHLQLFAEYGRMTMDDADGKPFQDLVFVIRDWHHPQDHAFGGEGGNALVNQRLNSNRGSLALRRQHIKSCFTDISGFLLPYPGEAVAGSPTFTGDAEDMRPEFIKGMEDLMLTLFSPEKLSVKMSGNRPMTCRQLATLIETYTNLFRSEKLPDVKGFLHAVAEAANMAAVDDELHTYIGRMKRLMGEDAPALHDRLLHDEQEQAKAEALKSLELRKTMKDPTKSENHYYRLLSDRIDDWFKSSQEMFKVKQKKDELAADASNNKLSNECLSSFEKAMDKLSEGQLQDEKTFRNKSDKAKQEELKRFDNRMVEFPSYKNAKSIREKLENSLKNTFSTHWDKHQKRQHEVKVARNFKIGSCIASGIACVAAGPVGWAALGAEAVTAAAIAAGAGATAALATGVGLGVTGELKEANAKKGTKDKKGS